MYFISQAQCRYYFRKMDINDPPPSHPGFVNLVKRLTTSGRNSNDVIKFLKYYGTHYLSEVTLGARFLKKLEVSQTNYEEFRTKKISVEGKNQLFRTRNKDLPPPTFKSPRKQIPLQ